jgi:hypothetical protein
MVPDPLHIGHHLHGRRNGAQISRNGLLLDQQLETDIFYLFLFPVDQIIILHDPPGLPDVLTEKRFNALPDGVFNHVPHLYHFGIQQLELPIKFNPHALPSPFIRIVR